MTNTCARNLLREEKRMIKELKKFCIISSICISALLISPTVVSAKSLKDSFYSSSNYSCTSINPLGGKYWKKSATAGTKGYKKNHYVRAYIGSGRDSSKWWADTGRQYSQGDIEKTCTTSEQYVPKDTFKETCFPKAHAKYGTT